MGAGDDGRADPRAAFTRQAATYAASAVVADREGRRRFVAAVAPAPGARVLDVATGPGFTARAFAERARLVVGVDLTAAMLARARAEAAPAGATPVRYVLGDAARLPVATGGFDVVACGNALHHFPAVAPVLRELVRACRPGGVLALSDLASDGDPAKAAVHNAIERLRDPSHVRAYTPGELAALLRGLGLTVRSVATTTARRGTTEWFAIARTPPDAAAEARQRLAATIAGDAAGLHAGWEERDGRPELCFTHTTAWIVAEVGGPA